MKEKDKKRSVKEINYVDANDLVNGCKGNFLNLQVIFNWQTLQTVRSNSIKSGKVLESLSTWSNRWQAQITSE